MKRIFPLLLLCFPLLLAAEDAKLDSLVTLDGKVYQSVTIRKVDPDGLSILHEAGTAKVPFEKLPEELREQYGYDEAAAAEHRKQVAEAQRKQDAAERTATEKRKNAAAKAAAAEADKEFAEKVQRAAKMVRIEAFQDSKIGLIGDIEEGTLISQAVKSTLGSTVGHKPAWVYRGRAKGGIIAGTTGAEVVKSVDGSGAPYGLPDTTRTYISWEGKAWRIGKISYRDYQGIVVSAPFFTASEKQAAAFYKRHGFGAKSESITQESR
jgi:hypothetical protein